jgi:hypothetical protein
MIGIAGSMAGSPLAQIKGSDVERTQQDAGAQQRGVQNELKAESAAGVGQADGEDHQTADRDADGRRPWEWPAAKKPATAADQEPAPPKDPGGDSGNLLDLSG